MRCVIDYLTDKFIESPLFEFAEVRAKAEKDIKSLGRQIFLRLIKIQYWVDDVNYKKHLRDIDTWLYEVDDLRLKPNSKRPKESDYYNWLYEDRNSSIDVLDNMIRKSLREYHNLPRSQMSLSELNDNMLKIYKQLAKDMACGEFETIQDYLK